VDQAALRRLSGLVGRLRGRAAMHLPRVLARVGALRRPLTALAVLVLVAVAALVVVTALRPGLGRPGGTSPVWIGVHDGDSIPDYVRLSRAALAALAADEPDHVGYALVSLGRYLSPDDVAAVLGGVPGVSNVTAYARVPLPGRQTERVALAAIQLPGDLTAAMTGVADRKEADAAAYSDLAGEQPEGTLRAIYASNAEVSRAEASAYRRTCACVFALVVRASATALLELSDSPDVRAVDPAPELRDPTQAVFAPPLPEQVDRAGPPPDDGLPSAGG